MGATRTKFFDTTTLIGLGIFVVVSVLTVVTVDGSSQNIFAARCPPFQQNEGGLLLDDRSRQFEWTHNGKVLQIDGVTEGTHVGRRDDKFLYLQVFSLSKPVQGDEYACQEVIKNDYTGYDNISEEEVGHPVETVKLFTIRVSHDDGGLIVEDIVVSAENVTNCHHQPKGDSLTLWFYMFVGVSTVLVLLLTCCCGYICKIIVCSRPSIYYQMSPRHANLDESTLYSYHRYSRPIYWNADSPSYFLCYNRTKFEIPLTRFKTENSQALGDGAYGTVVNGYFGETKVAVKLSNGDRNRAAILMSEIKILGYLDNHENIVRLVGASTKFEEEGQVHMFIELCPLGDLRSFVRANVDLYSMMLRVDEREVQGQVVQPALGTGYTLFDSALFSTVADPHNIAVANEIIVDDDPLQNWGVAKHQSLRRESVAPVDKFIWAHQIANGMEYLARKEVVHADLAARNILLRTLHQVKIADFGLSRIIKEQKSVEFLPWTHMALETLEDGCFTHESDVWAYGVTVWELFSLCAPPYGDRKWSENFREDLKTGHRLERPIGARVEIFRVLHECWNSDPGQRPNFVYLKEFFQDQSERMKAAT